ncbi:MAG TPA: hypothetical protein PKK12_07085 [Candidatus Aminicenantes bacterium]|nr:hypothetical protein [Candidatus Aminicenantes bacterium]
MVTREKGFKGRLRLTVMTGVPSSRVVEMTDETAQIARFKRAASEILGEDVELALSRNK